MAIESEAKIIVSAVDKYSAEFGNLNKGFGELSKTAMIASTAVATFAVGMAALTVKMGSSAVQSAADFRDAMFDVSAVVGKAGASTEQIGTILDGLVQKFPVTGAQAGQALESIAQFGFGAEEQLKNISDAAVGLQIATGTDLNTTVAALTATLNQFGLEATETARVSNVLAAAQFNSAASVSDLREGLKFAGPVAKLFGKDLESTVGVLSKLKDGGLEASQVGTVLRGALAALSKGTRESEETLAKYGLVLEDLNPQTKSYVEIIEAFKGQTISGADAIKIFGVEASGFSTIINQGTDSLQKRIGQVTATSAAEDAAAEKSKKWSVVLNNLGGTLDVFKKTIARNLLPVIIDFIGKDENSGIRGVIDQLFKLEKSSGGIGGPLIEAFQALQAATKDVFDSSFQGDIENVYKWLSDISKALSENIKIIITLGAEFTKLFVDSTTGGEKLQGLLKIANVSITAIALSVAVVRDAFTGFYLIATDGATELQVVFYEFEVALDKWVLKLYQSLDALPFVNMTKEIENVSNRITYFGEKIQEGNAKLADSKPAELWSTSVLEASAKNIASIEKIGEKAKETVKNIPEIELKIDGEQAVSDMGDISDEIVDVQAKASEEITKKEKEEITKRIDEERKAKEERNTILENRIESTQNILDQEEQIYEESIAKINLAEAEGRKGYEDSAKEKLKLEEEYLKNKIDLTEKTYADIKELYPEDAEKQKEAFADVKDAQLEFTEFKIAKIEEEREALKSSLESEIEIRSANAEIAKIEIEKQENAGVISAQDAVNKKKAIDEEFLNFKISKLSETISVAAEEYGRDSEEYTNAVLAKKQAELELSEVIKSTGDAAEEASQATIKASAESTTASTNDLYERRKVSKENFDATMEEIANVREFATSVSAGTAGYFSQVEIDKSILSLKDLGTVYDELSLQVGTFSSNTQGFGEFVREQAMQDFQAIEALQAQFGEISTQAQQAGLSVNNMNMALEEAAADTESRIEGWNAFKESLGEISNNVTTLSSEYTNLSDSLGGDSTAEAVTAFDNLVDSTGDLQKQISAVNAEFGSGSIEIAEEMADAVIDSYDEIYDSAVDVLDDLKDEWQSLADQIEEINGKITDIQLSTEEKIREAKRKTMDELGVFQDVRLEYEEVYAQAQSELAQRNFDTAAELFEKAADLAGDLQQEITDSNGEVVSTLEENTALSIKLMTQASDAAVNALEGQSTSLANQQSMVQDQIGQTISTIDSLGNQIGTMTENAANQIGTMTTAFNNFSDNVNSGSDFNINFTGTGSSTKPLSEKINEMSGKVTGFDNSLSGLSPKINADFTGISDGIGFASKQIQDLTDRSLIFQKALGFGGSDETNQDNSGGLGFAINSELTGEDFERQTSEITGGFEESLIENVRKPLENIFNTQIGDVGLIRTTTAIGGGGDTNYADMIAGQQAIVEAIQAFSFPEQFNFNVSVQSDSQAWLDGLVESIIDQIFVKARLEDFNAFGQEG